MSSETVTITIPADQEETFHAILAAVEASQLTAPKAKKKGKKARRTPNRKPVVGGAVEGKRCLTGKNRKQFIADHDWAVDGTSTQDLVKQVAAGAALVGDWAIGPKYAAKHGVPTA